jgi:hypothetical protein
VLHEDAGHGRCLERQLTRGHLVADDAEGVEVAAGVDLPLARRLLRPVAAS